MTHLFVKTTLALTALCCMAFFLDTQSVSSPASQNCTWLLNPGFNLCGPNGCNPAPAITGPSAAAKWQLHSDNKHHPVSSVVESTEECSCEDKKMLRITCKSNESGVYQIFKPRQKHIKVTARVKVLKGKVMLFVARDGFASQSVSTGPTTGWKCLELETDGTVLNNWVGVYNQDPAGGEFAIDHVCIELVP